MALTDQEKEIEVLRARVAQIRTIVTDDQVMQGSQREILRVHDSNRALAEEVTRLREVVVRHEAHLVGLLDCVEDVRAALESARTLTQARAFLRDYLGFL